MSVPASSDDFSSLVSARPARASGGILLATLFMVTAMLLIVAPLVDLSLQTYKLTMRNRIRAQARAVAESELDYMFYKFMTQVSTGSTAEDAPLNLGNQNIVDYIAAGATDAAPTTLRNAFLLEHKNQGWRVKRSMQFIHSEYGRIPGTTKIGDFSYVTGRVEILPPVGSPLANSVALRIGRRFVNSSTPIFQYGVFFEGDLELNPGSDTIIDGDVVANGSVFMAPRAGFDLTLKGKIRSEHFNTLDDGTTEALVNPDAPIPIGITFDDPTFFYTSDQQLEELTERENLLGGIDANASAKSHPELFGPTGKTNPDAWNAADILEAENNVFRSLLVPPPSAASPNEYPNASSGAADDANIGAQRLYNRADLIVTVAENGNVSITKNGADVTATYQAAVVGATESAAVTDLYDNRESKVVKITTVDIAALGTALAGDSSFNGLMYVNLQNVSSTNPAAVRLINATTLPTDSSGRGFSVVTNGGLYVQGSYNTATSYTNPATGAVTNFTDEDGNPRNIPSMLMGDSLTVLSSNFSPAASSTAIGTRVASLTATETTTGGVQVNAGLLTGNVSSGSSSSSGGVQNLVRYLEDWTGIDIVYKGSLGRLFNSKWFTAPFSAAGGGQVYRPPNTRTFTFDDNLQTLTPPGTPTTTGFNLGVYFTW